MAKLDLLIGIDVGGTFTDAVVFDGEKGVFLNAFKIASTPADPGRAVVAAIDRIARDVNVRGATVFHGTTVGTNTLIERKGARTALLSTEGFSDVIEIRRQARPSLYNFDVSISEPLVPKSMRVDVPERTSADGTVLRKAASEEAVRALRSAGVESVAISFLHSYANAENEDLVAVAIEKELPGLYVTRSSDVCPEFREYERSSTTVVNAYIGPAVGNYISRLEKELRSRGVDRLMVVKSNGGLTSPANAARYPVHLIESGPAAQLIASASFARATGRRNLVSFDMGGTTAKAGLIRDAKPELTSEFYADRLVEGADVGGYAVRSPMLDLVEIGAGGGSIAWIDDGKVLKVGPTSAGASPGPACYGRGGELPTVTDAHAVIGTLSEEGFRSSGISLQRELAVEAISKHIAQPFGWPLSRAAYSILDIAVANMAEMVRLATTRKGVDPRSYSILASGGAGPLHAALVGKEIGAMEVLIPPHPGMFSAFGATLGAVRHEFTQTLLSELRLVDPSVIAEQFQRLRHRAEAVLKDEPAGISKPTMERIIEARFIGQLFELKLGIGLDGDSIPSVGEIEEQFRAIYRAEYGFDLPQARVQIVNLRLVAEIDLGHRGEQIFARRSRASRVAKPHRQTPILSREGSEALVPVYRVAESAGGRIEGPAIFEHSGSTVWIVDGQTACVGESGEVVIDLRGDL